MKFVKCLRGELLTTRSSVIETEYHFKMNNVMRVSLHINHYSMTLISRGKELTEEELIEAVSLIPQEIFVKNLLCDDRTTLLLRQYRRTNDY